MKGHIRQRGARSWEIKFDGGRDPVNGARNTRWHSFKGTKREAQTEMTRLMAEAQQGRSVSATKTTIGQFLDEFERDWAPANVGAKTRERYGELLRVHVRPHIGCARLQKIETADLNRLYLRLVKPKKDGGAGLSPRTVGHVHRVVHKALSVARGLGLVARNVASEATTPRVTETEIEILNEEQVGAVLGKLRGRALYPLVVVALATGMRRGEILALRWNDLDLVAGTCRIDESIEEPKAGTLSFKGTKTRHGRRTITLPAFAVAELRTYRAAALEERMRLGLGKLSDDGLVFGHPDGSTRSPNGLTREWSRNVVKLGLPKVTLHALRHTHASQLIAAGVDVVMITALGPRVADDHAARLRPPLQRHRRPRGRRGGTDVLRLRETMRTFSGRLGGNRVVATDCAAERLPYRE